MARIKAKGDMGKGGYRESRTERAQEGGQVVEGSIMNGTNRTYLTSDIKNQGCHPLLNDCP